MKKKSYDWCREMGGVIPNHHHSYNLFLVLAILFYCQMLSTYGHTLSSAESLTILSKQTIVSLGDEFELGFFKPSASLQDGDRWYLGIWYKRIPERTYVWVANRDNPLSNSTGTFKISGSNLVLFDQSNRPVWSTNLTGAVRTQVEAELLPNGNFVLRDSKTKGEAGILWQSFDYPTDTLLPQMKLGLDRKTGHNKFLISWRNLYDPSSGSLSYKLEMHALPEFFIRRTDVEMSRSGPWDGFRFSGFPDMQRWNDDNIVYNFTENKEEVVFSYRVTTPSIYSRLQLTVEGTLQLYIWDPTIVQWVMVWNSWKGVCDLYMRCSIFSYCNPNTTPVCSCITGFESMEQDPPYCVRKTNLSCSGDGFHRLRNVKLPETKVAKVNKRIGVKECEERCLRDCNCTAFAKVETQGDGMECVMWTAELRDIRNFANGGQDLYVRLASADLEKPNNNSGKTRTTIGLSVGATLLFLLSFIIYFFWRKHKQERELAALTDTYGCRRQNLLRTNSRHLFGSDREDLELPLIEYDVVTAATNNFSNCNKIGEGGFGAVYKGTLPDGEEIAVKRLSEVSTQGTTEFATELQLIAKLQHNNLVRLRGCYADADDKILVYEYMENLSLDYYLFDKTKSFELNWKKRFDIIKGIARGLLYLHEDSRCRVIHRDLKASNILLDKNMIPKISDFGMARIFGRDEEQATTRRIVGTYGYMPPEYVTKGTFSEKSDVFSFGVLLLEIVSGRRSSGFTKSDLDTNLLSFMWRNFEEGTISSVVDPNIIDSASPSPTYRVDEVIRCIKIGLLCVQEHAEDRPTMSWVVVILGSAKEEIPDPKQPAYCSARMTCEAETSSTITNVGYNVSEVKAR